MASETSKRRRVDRQPLTVQILGGRRAPLSARIVYRDTYVEGRNQWTELGFGKPIYSMPGIRAVGEEWPDNVRPELADLMEILQVAQRQVLQACLDIDQATNKPTQKRAKKR